MRKQLKICLLLISKKNTPTKKVSGNISDISKSNSEDLLSDCDGNSSRDSNESVPSLKNKKPKINVKGNWY